MCMDDIASGKSPNSWLLLNQPKLSMAIVVYKRLVVRIALLRPPRGTYILYLAAREVPPQIDYISFPKLVALQVAPIHDDALLMLPSIFSVKRPGGVESFLWITSFTIV